MESDVNALIDGDESTCRIVHPTAEGTDSFYGSHESTEMIVANNVPIEFLAGKPEGLEQEGADASANIACDVDVLEGDFLVVDTVRFRITHLDPHNAFGARTHQTLILEREYRHQS